MAIYDSHELAWAAGFFDGEGSFLLSRNRKGLAYARASIRQADVGLANLERFMHAVGDLGKIFGPYDLHPDRRPIYQYQANRLDVVETIGGALWLWLGEVKREQFRRVISQSQGSHPRTGNFYSSNGKTHCKRNHEYAITGQTKWGQCRECMRESDRRHSPRAPRG